MGAAALLPPPSLARARGIILYLTYPEGEPIYKLSTWMGGVRAWESLLIFIKVPIMLVSHLRLSFPI